MSHLDSVEPTSLGELAEHMGVTASTMSISVSRLERQGYLRKDRDVVDGRVVSLRLTEAGEAVRAAQSVLDPELVGAMFDELSPQELERGLDGLSILAEAASRSIKSRKASRAEEVSSTDAPTTRIN